jgi:hypothetical protein
MVLITSGKQFVLTIIGEVPPGLKDEQVSSVVLQQVTVAMMLAQFVRASAVQVVRESPEALASRLGMTLKPLA